MASTVPHKHTFASSGPAKNTKKSDLCKLKCRYQKQKPLAAGKDMEEAICSSIDESMSKQ